MMGPACRGGREATSRHTIEAMLPAYHLLCRIDRCLDTSELKEHWPVTIAHGDDRRCLKRHIAREIYQHLCTGNDTVLAPCRTS